MSYSQRAPRISASSDIVYLEYEIGTLEEQIIRLKDAGQDCVSALNLLKASPGYDPAVESAEERELTDTIAGQRTRLAETQARLEALRNDLAGFEE